jgi:major membrane immunogen (membrane-anchored lipoprotein)
MSAKVASAIAVGVLVVACSSKDTAVADDPNNTSTKIADNGKYGTYLDVHQVDGRTITCIVVVGGGSSQAVSCDWTAK